MKQDVNKKENHQNIGLLIITFYPVLIACVALGIFVALKIFATDSSKPASLSFLVALVACAITSSILSIFIWLFLCRIIFGGPYFYQKLQAISFRIFKDGSLPSNKTKSIYTYSDKLVKFILGVK